MTIDLRRILRRARDEIAARVHPRHLPAWGALWAFWVVASQRHHPNLGLNAAASALLVVTFACACYSNHCGLIPFLWRSGRYAAYSSALLAVVARLSLTCTLSIQLVYDLCWGPDPRRFGFWANYAMEFALISLHVALIASGVAAWNVLRRRATAPAAIPGDPAEREPILPPTAG